MKPKRKILRTEEKEQQILDAARSVFLEAGFDRANTDEIARRAKVSKATLYGYFPDKRSLFIAFMENAAGANRAGLFPPHPEQPIRETLRLLGTALLSMLLSTDAQKMFRLAIAESVRFPELSRALFQSGQEQGVKQIAAIIREATEEGELNALNPELAAAQFVELCRADLFYRVVYGIVAKPNNSNIDIIVDEAIETFMARYGG